MENWLSSTLYIKVSSELLHCSQGICKYLAVFILQYLNLGRFIVKCSNANSFPIQLQKLKLKPVSTKKTGTISFYDYQCQIVSLVLVASPLCLSSHLTLPWPHQCMYAMQWLSNSITSGLLFTFNFTLMGCDPLLTTLSTGNSVSESLVSSSFAWTYCVFV